MYESYLFKGEFAYNFSEIIYENNKNDLIYILKSLKNNSYLPILISFLSKTNYHYYEIEIKNYLNKHFSLGLSIYESLQYIKDEEFKNSFVLKYIAKWSDYKKYDTNFRNSILNFIKNNKENTLKALVTVSNSEQSLALSLLFKIEKKIAYDFIWDILTTAKLIKLKLDIVNYLLKFTNKKDEIKKDMILKFSSKKVNVREIAINFIVKTSNKEDEVLLKKFLEKEKSDKVRKIIIDFFIQNKIFFSDNSEKAKSEKKLKEFNLFSKEWFIYSSKSAKKKNIGWLDLNLLPKLHYKNNGEEIGEKELFYFINIAVSENSIISSKQLNKFGELIKESDLSKFAKKMYELWDRQTKNKWALVYVATFGDNSLVNPLKNEILRFIDCERGAIAAQIVEVIAMIRTKNAFQTLDWFTRKVKHKQVKSTAEKALLTIARELNITKEELLDKIIPDPLSNKNMKTQIKLQKKRLEDSFSRHRLWSVKNWKKVFIKNSMMKELGLTLIWGVYDNNKKLIKEFRFLKDESFSNIKEEKIKLKSHEKIALIPPIELSNESLKIWKEQLDNYKIIQAFMQLNRSIYKVADTDRNKLKLKDFMGLTIHRSLLKNKLINKGWKAGFIEGTNCYYDYYKDLEYYNFSVKLSFAGDCMNENNITIKEIVFYRFGEYSNGERYPLKQVPKRLYSEIYNEIKIIF